MKYRATFAALAASAIIVAIPALVRTNQDLTDQTAVEDATVEFGDPNQMGVPNQVLIPNEVTIFKGGTVTFRANGAGHGIAIYPVSKNTARAHIEEDLCQGGTAACNADTGTANLQYKITDGDGNLIIDTGMNPPENRVNYKPGQEVSVGAGQFLNGTAPGTGMRVRFHEDGRYLVICMNRGHSLNNWMFGFVNVR